MELEHELNRLADVYRERGYDVVVRPAPDQLPAFAKHFRVEIVGRRGAGGVLVAVRKNRSALAADDDVPGYAELTGSQPGWRFDLAILEREEEGAREARGAVELSEGDIARTVQQAQELSRLGFTRFAVTAAWAALEAAMRMRLRAAGQEAGWGSKPGEMVKELYSAGELSPDEFRRVEEASRLRNQIVHGFASPPVWEGGSEAAVVELLGDIVRRLVNETQFAGQPA